MSKNIVSIVANDRSYLQQNLQAQLDGADVYFYHDNRADKNCYIVENLDPTQANSDLLAFVHQKTGGTYNEVATIAQDAVVKCPNGDILMFRNTPAEQVRALLYDDMTPRNYKLVFKTAEMHTYVQLINMQTGKDYIFSASGKSPVQWHGPAYLRDDRPFDKKYYKGDVFHDPSVMIPDFDCGSISTSFDLTDKQAAMLQVFLANHEEYLKQSHSLYYDLFFNNCSCFAQLVYNSVLCGEFAERYHYFTYHIADELNFRDKGVFYNFLLSESFDGIISNLDSGVDIINQFLLGQGTAELGRDEYLTNDLWRPLLDSYGNTAAHVAAYKGDIATACSNMNARNAFGETPLHIAIRFGNFSTAIALITNGADVNMVDINYQTPLYIALLQSRDTAGFSELINMLVDKTDMLDVTSYSGYATPLTLAVQHNDISSVQTLIAGGADLDFIDRNGDNLLHVALLTNADRVAEYLSTHYPYLALQQNIDGDLPDQVVEGRQMIARYVFQDLDEFLGDDLGVDEASFIEIERMYNIYPDAQEIMTEYSFLM